MNTQRSHSVSGGHNLSDWIIFPNVPELYLPISTPRNKLSKAPTLHVHIRDPLLVLAPAFDHSQLGLFASIENADGAVAVTGTEDIAGYLVRGQGCDTGARASRNIL